jgi:ABC-2 type transport system permease protein
MVARSGPLEAAPIFLLTLRQFMGGRAIRVVFFFSLVPALFAGIYALNAQGTTSREFLDGLFQGFVAPTLLPIATLILATNALGNEIEDRTMVYLVLKPISRARIILEKFASVIVTAVLLLWEGMLLAFVVAARGDAGDNLDQLVAMVVAILFGVLGYGALFLAVSLIVPRALLAGILYSLLWESLFGYYIPGVRLISVRHYVLSIYDRIVDDALIDVEQAMQLVPSIIVIIGLVVVALTVATWRLRTMNLE